MEGSLTLEWQGRRLTLRRGPKGTTAWGAFSAVWTATGENVEGLTAETCGETLLGVSREVFERTAFVEQGQMALTPSSHLEMRVAALATTGEEDVSGTAGSAGEEGTVGAFSPEQAPSERTKTRANSSAANRFIGAGLLYRSVFSAPLGLVGICSG